MSKSGGEKTEEATPKKKADAREKGQVAKSPDLSGSIILLTGVMVLGWVGPAIVELTGGLMAESLSGATDFERVNREGVGSIMVHAGMVIAMAVAPIAFACLIAALAVGVLQVGPKPMPKALKPDPKRLNPLQGFKNIFGPNMFFEGAKNVTKVSVVGAIVLAAVAPKLTELGALVGIEPAQLAAALAGEVRGIAMRAAAAYFVIGLVDFGYQRYRNNKQLKMDKQEVKEEGKGQALPAEVRGAIRRRQIEASRGRMMAAVPDADVVVTNPTHFSVALKYHPGLAAPEVVAKGQDIIALRIRELAAENGVPVVPNPPLARGLYAGVEVGQQIPEEFYAAVAQVLAYIYRVANRRGGGAQPVGLPAGAAASA